MGVNTERAMCFWQLVKSTTKSMRKLAKSTNSTADVEFITANEILLRT